MSPIAMPIFHSNTAQDRSANALIQWLLGFILSLQAKYYVSNKAIEFLLRFLHLFFSVLGRFSPFLKTLHDLFPQSLHAMYKSVKYEDNFKKYIVCLKCSKLYTYNESIETIGRQKSSKLCNWVRYPEHPHASRRSPCQTLLLKTVIFRSGNKILYPFKTYCYKSVQSTLQDFLLRPQFYASCQHWKSKPQSTLSEVYAGRVWNEFQTMNGLPLLAGSLTLAVTLNVDWFQPFTHTVYSVGVIYLTILNLPRFLRYKLENVIIVGIIPGPKEPEHDINSYLQPLVNELLVFFSGLTLRVNTPLGIIEENVKCILLCVSCDLPAGRKCCGFLSHNARLGCSRCFKEFPGSVGQQNYSGFDRSEWHPRTNEQHRKDVETIKQCKTKTQQIEKESLLGCRYSAFLDLPYFNAPRFLVIDPMHNLFLGTGKHMINLWIQSNILASSNFLEIQNFVDTMTVPSDIGRIPHKIQSGFAAFKADQYKTWITVFSIPALYSVLPSNHLECWRHFVLACRILCQQTLSNNDVLLADALLIYFCKKVEQLFGEACVTPNMHMHGHIKDILLDYGPVQEFWCFSFERFNGILGNQPTNNREIEPQLFQRFLRDRFSNRFEFPSEFKEDFSQFDMQPERLVGSLLDTVSDYTEFELPSKSARGVFDTIDIMYLDQLYKKIFPSDSCAAANTIFRKYSTLKLKGKMYGSSGKSTQKPYIALALWDESLFGTPLTQLPDNESATANERPVNIHYYLKATFSNTNDKSLVLAYVSWPYPHPDRNKIGKPAQLWCSNMNESFGVHSFLPLKCIICRCAHGLKKIQDEELLIVVPLVE